ncbi:MAG TPA: hypothetical protein VGM20_10080 [Gemmatimonadales bacterium]|jgi:hypothetical protein
MHIYLRRSFTIAAFTLIGARAGAQSVPSPGRYDWQLRAAARLEGVPAVPRHPDVDARHASNAPAIGAAIGAVALPAIGYVTFHDRDSGPFGGGGILLLAAIGAFLGYMVGLAVRGR